MKNLLSGKILNAILEDLNLKKDEEFGIKNLNTKTTFKHKYKINHQGLRWCNNGFWESSLRLDELLLRQLKIFKLPFIPKLNELYYYPNITSTDLYDYAVNYNGEYDRRRIIHEMCFRTKEEAIAKAGEWLKILGKKEVTNESKKETNCY